MTSAATARRWLPQVGGDFRPSGARSGQVTRSRQTTSSADRRQLSASAPRQRESFYVRYRSWNQRPPVSAQARPVLVVNPSVARTQRRLTVQEPPTTAGKSPHEGRIRAPNRVQSCGVSRPAPPRQGAGKPTVAAAGSRVRTAHPPAASRLVARDSDSSNSDYTRPLLRGQSGGDPPNFANRPVPVPPQWARLPTVDWLDDEDSDVFEGPRPSTTQLTGRSQYCAPSLDDDASDLDDGMRRRRKDRGLFENYGDLPKAWNYDTSHDLPAAGIGNGERGTSRRKSEKEPSSRRHVHLFSRLSHEAQLAINETRREMAQQERIVDDADLEDGCSVEIEPVPVVNGCDPQLRISTPRGPAALNSTAEGGACVRHLKSDWRQTSCQLCSCQSRAERLQKDSSTLLVPTPRAANKEKGTLSASQIAQTEFDLEKDRSPSTAPAKIGDVNNCDIRENRPKETPQILISGEVDLSKGRHAATNTQLKTYTNKNVEFVAHVKVTHRQVLLDEVNSDGTESSKVKTILPRIKTPRPDVTFGRGPRLRPHVPGLGPSKIVPFGMRREATFQITPVGYDCRYNQPPWPGPHDDTPEEVKAKAVQKCSDWIVKYL